MKILHSFIMNQVKTSLIFWVLVPKNSKFLKISKNSFTKKNQNYWVISKKISIKKAMKVKKYQPTAKKNYKTSCL